MPPPRLLRTAPAIIHGGHGSRPDYNWLIVGAGFAGSVLAECLARERGDRVATYRYLNMDQMVGQALATFQRIEKALPQGQPGCPVMVHSA